MKAHTDPASILDYVLYRLRADVADYKTVRRRTLRERACRFIAELEELSALVSGEAGARRK